MFYRKSIKENINAFKLNANKVIQEKREGIQDWVNSTEKVEETPFG